MGLPSSEPAVTALLCTEEAACGQQHGVAADLAMCFARAMPQRNAAALISTSLESSDTAVQAAIENRAVSAAAAWRSPVSCKRCLLLLCLACTSAWLLVQPW